MSSDILRFPLPAKTEPGVEFCLPNVTVAHDFQSLIEVFRTAQFSAGGRNEENLSHLDLPRWRCCKRGPKNVPNQIPMDFGRESELG